MLEIDDVNKKNVYENVDSLEIYSSFFSRVNLNFYYKIARIY